MEPTNEKHHSWRRFLWAKSKLLDWTIADVECTNAAHNVDVKKSDGRIGFGRLVARSINHQRNYDFKVALAELPAVIVNALSAEDAPQPVSKTEKTYSTGAHAFMHDFFKTHERGPTSTLCKETWTRIHDAFKELSPAQQHQYNELSRLSLERAALAKHQLVEGDGQTHAERASELIASHSVFHSGNYSGRPRLSQFEAF